ncbi:hypothetical protein GCM10008915_56450 [Bifidobacterium pullorum subsp. gallinarum]
MGHYLILKLVYRESRAGIVLGDINGSREKSFKVCGIPVIKYSRPAKKLRQTRGLAYPWNHVYFGSRKWKLLLFAIAGPAAEGMVGIVFMIMGIWLALFEQNHHYVTLLISFLVLSTNMMTLFFPCIKLWEGKRKEAMEIRNKDVQALTNTTFGFTDGRLIWSHSRLLFWIYTAIAFLSYLVACSLVIYSVITVISTTR